MTRARAEIGAGLEAARPTRRIRPGERIHVVGAAGAGASAAALHAHWAGAVVSGCDAGGPTPYTAALDAAGIPVLTGHAPAHVTGADRPDRLAVTKALTAIDPHHPELEAAREQGIPREPWQQVIADAAHGRTLVAVAGTHGKSTTAGWLLHVLIEAGLDPAGFVGALLPGDMTGGLPATARRGAGPAFVVEADEYAGNFDPYRPQVAAVTNVEWDHPDVFVDRDAVERVIADWLIGSADSGDHGTDPAALPITVVNTADPGAAHLLARLHAPADRVVRVGLATDDGADGVGEGEGGVLVGRIAEVTPQGTVLAIEGLDGTRPVLARLRLAGAHNASNALVVAGTAMALGVAPEAIVAGLASFRGVGRRLERKGEAGDVVVYDDYGHHPSAIRATLGAVRQREPDRPVWAVYEPLTYHRTAALIDQFAEALAEADGAVIADIWAGRDRDTSVTSSTALAAAVAARAPGMTVAAPGSVELTAAWLASAVRPGDVVLVMGGGRSYRIGELLLELLAEQSGGAAP